MKGKEKIKIILTGLAIALILFTLTGGLGADEQADKVNRGLKALEDMQNAFRTIAQKVIPSVVEIRTTNVVKIPENWPFQFIIPEREKENPNDSKGKEFQQSGLGSGVIVERRGNKIYVLTNHHVIENARDINIQLADKRQFNASLVGSDPHKDLALIFFETNESVPIAELGNSDTVSVGDWVIAIGNPFGFSSTITVGIVSAIGRERNGSSFTDYIQTDAAINQGNSGGALVNIRGQVIGINTWIASPSGGSVGIGFAIPINKAKKDINDFLTKGKVEYGWLGVTIGDLTKSFAKELSLENKKGAFIYGVYTNSPAGQGGIKAGDLIISVDEKQIKSSSDLLNAVANINPSKQVVFKLIRSGKEISLKITLSARPDEKTLRENNKYLWPGFTVNTLTDDIKQRLKIEKNVTGVFLSSVTAQSRAALAGLKEGDIITRINNINLNSIADFYRVINESSPEYQVRVLRGKNEVIFVLKKE